jgi:hypothetical protein
MGLIPKRIKRGLLLRVLLHVTKGLAKGKYGKRPQKVWNFFEGGKTWIGFGFMVLGFAAGEAFNMNLCPACPEWNQGLMAVGAVLAQVGLLDAANREPGPQPGPE